MLLVDFSWILHRSYHLFKDFKFVLKDGSVVKTGTVFGVFNSYKSLRSAFPEETIVYCLEGEVNSRFEVESYKATRERRPDVHEHKEAILSMLAGFENTQFVQPIDGEADDAIYALAKAAQHTVFVHSRDSDLMGLVELPNVRIFHKIEKGQPVCITREEVENKFGLTENLIKGIAILKALKGDGSDNVIKIADRFPKKIALEIARNCTSYEDVISYPIPEPWQAVIRSKCEEVRKNLLLTTLRDGQLKEIHPEQKPTGYFEENFGIRGIAGMLKMPLVKLSKPE